jgi:hypothetical protein
MPADLLVDAICFRNWPDVESWYSTGIPSTTPKSTEAVIALRHGIGPIA